MNGADPTRKISKRIVGMTTPCTELATLLYEQIFGEFSSSAAAETGTPPRNARHASAATVHDTTVSSRTFGIDILPAAEVVGQIRDQAPVLVVSGVMDALNEKQKSLKGSRILALGVACKRDTSHSRDSAAVEIMRGLHKKGALVYYSDPYVPSVKLDDCILKSQEMTPEILRAMDCVLILTDHSAFDYGMIAAHSFLILTRRNTLMDLSGSNVVRF
jgi:UDP-N-acetyl-D-mannosaminuronate dehydrogenase